MNSQMVISPEARRFWQFPEMVADWKPSLTPTQFLQASINPAFLVQSQWRAAFRGGGCE